MKEQLGSYTFMTYGTKVEWPDIDGELHKLVKERDSCKKVDRDEYFMSLAFVASTLSKDPNTKVGAILVFDNNTYVSGYNGCPSGFNDSVLNTSYKQDVVIHAEINALNQAGLEKCRLNKNLRLYVLFKPCPRCAIQLIHHGVKEVIYYKDYKSTVNNDELLDLISRNGFKKLKRVMEIRKYSGPLLYQHNHFGIK